MLIKYKKEHGKNTQTYPSIKMFPNYKMSFLPAYFLLLVQKVIKIGVFSVPPVHHVLFTTMIVTDNIKPLLISC